MENKIIESISETFGVERSKINDNMTVGELGADSLDLVELTLDMEEEFDLSIPDDQIGNDTTIREIIDYIKLKTDE